MGTVNVPRILLPRIACQNYTLNGQPAPVMAPQRLAQGVNQAMRWCTKELYVTPGAFDEIAASGGAGPTTRFRTWIHTGPFFKRLRWMVTMARPSSGSTGSPKATIAVTQTDGTPITSVDISYGYATVTAHTPDTFGDFSGTIEHDDIEPVIDYLINISVSDNARIVNVLLLEESLEPTTDNGYIPDLYSSVSPILDDVRSSARTAMYDLFRRGGAVILDWHGARVGSTATDTNIVDGSSTTVTAATPGFTLDMRYKARLKNAATGVNCKVRAYGNTDGGAGGRLFVKDSGGATLATVTGWNTTASWQSADLVLPATLAKYDIQIDNGGGATFNLSDVAIYEYET